MIDLVLRTRSSWVPLRPDALAARVAEAMRLLRERGASLEALTDLVLDGDDFEAMAQLHFCLRRIGEAGHLSQVALDEGVGVATLGPVRADGLAICPPDPQVTYVLSRFAYLHREEEGWTLETPLSDAHVVLHDWRLSVLAQRLSAGTTIAAAADSEPTLPKELVTIVVALLVHARLVSTVDAEGRSLEDRDRALITWEFHDLLFHARSRDGRTRGPIGATYRHAGVVPPPPSGMRTAFAGAIPLARPDLADLTRRDPPFVTVQERRRSIREYGSEPIALDQVSEFLYRTARVTAWRDAHVDTSYGSRTVSFAHRPYPGGGALYELELYLVVNSCSGLDAGLYHYDPLGHQLGPLRNTNGDVIRLLADASRSTGIPLQQLQILIVVAARVQRVAWKYSSMAYALILKNVGVLYQTMYLVATAMNLAPCAIGCGNSDAFAQATGLSYVCETSVGEFLIGTRREQLQT